MNSADDLTSGEKRKLSLLRKDLLLWSQAHGRMFPWRETTATGYDQIVVEVLLQRTTADAVARFFPPFKQRYPDWTSLSLAPIGELEEVMKPLGLWRRRAQSLSGLAKYAATSGGAFPRDPFRLAEIPAVGQYVSNAIGVFLHSQRAPLLDVNMARVIERFVRPRRLADIRYDPWLQAAAKWLVRDGDAASVNWATLDFAALVCKSARPDCLHCPLSTRCSFATNSVRRHGQPLQSIILEGTTSKIKEMR